MAKTRQQKEATVQAITDGIKDAKGVVFANFQGLSVPEIEELRAQCREKNIGCIVSKKTLIALASKNAGLDVDPTAFDGGVAVFMGMEDEVVAAKTVADFADDHDVVKVFGGVLEGSFIDSEKITALAKLPSKEELLAKLVGSLNAPISGFVNVLGGNLRGLVTVLQAIKDNKEA